MRKTLAAIALAAATLVPTQLFAVEGRVVGEASVPVAGVVVSIANEGRSVRTDANGHFSIDPEPRYPARIVVTAGDGSSQLLELAEKPDAPLEIVLVATASETITVSGAAAPHIEAPPANATDTLSSSDLFSLAPVQVADAVRTIPGVNTSDGGPSSVPSIRGLARGRTLMLLDGARLTTERRAGSAGGFVNPFSLGSIDVARGPGSVAYGSDALGGVIHLRSREPSASSPAFRFEAGTLAGGESTDALGIETAFDAAGSELLLTAYGRSGDDGEDGDGNSIENSSFRDYGFGARGSRVGSFGVLLAGLGIDRARDSERPAPPDDPSRSTYPIEDSDRLTLSLEKPGARGWSSFKMSGFAGRYRQLLDRSTPAAAGATTISSSDTESWDAALRASADRSIGTARLETGIDLNARLGLESLVNDALIAADGTIVSSRPSTAIEDARRIDTGAFVLTNLPLTKTSWLSAGLRADTIAASNEDGYFGDRSDRDSALSGHVALSLRTNESLVTTLQVARGFRAPTLSDRYYRGTSGRGFVTGNPLLEPETTLQFDGSARWQRGSSSIALFAYLYQIDDLIERYRQGTDFYFRNRGEAEIRGLELEAEGAITDRFSARLTASYSRGETADGTNDPLDDIAPPNARAEIRWRSGRNAASGALSWFDDHTRSGPSEVDRQGWTTLDVSYSRQLNRVLELRVTGANLTDETYYASPDAISALAAGRTFGVTLAGRFER